MSTEEVFRLQLQEAALACDWPAWDTTRLIFADLLGEQGSPEEHLARAAWRCVWAKQVEVPGRRPYIYLFEVACPPITGAVGIGRYNANQLLHFAPGSLRLLRYIPRDLMRAPAVQFSWCPSRRLNKQRRYTDCKRKGWPLGFLHLFAVKRPERSLFT